MLQLAQAQWKQLTKLTPLLTRAWPTPFCSVVLLKTLLSILAL